eukprot:UN02521
MKDKRFPLSNLSPRKSSKTPHIQQKTPDRKSSKVKRSSGVKQSVEQHMQRFEIPLHIQMRMQQPLLGGESCKFFDYWPDAINPTPLMVSVVDDHIGMVELLLQKSANVNLQDRNGFSALCASAAYGFEDVAEALIKYKADMNLTTKT